MHSVERDSGKRNEEFIFIREMPFSLSYDDSVYNILPVIIWVDNFFQEGIWCRVICVLEEAVYLRKRCVSWQKYQLADLRNQHAETTGVKHRHIINLTFHNRFVIHFDHQNSGLYSYTKWNSLKSISVLLNQVTAWETMAGIW